MSNLRGLGEKKRQLFATVVRSVAMYAAPVWGEVFASSPERITRPLRKLQRTIVIRVTAAYRTVSYDAVTLLARSPPWKLEATLRSRIYNRSRDSINRNEFSHEVEAEIRNGENLLLVRQWNILLSNPEVWGAVTIAAIQPHLSKWLLRNFGEINFYITQMLTGHGSFGHYLRRMNKRETAECYHCTADDDTEHTIFECPSWDTTVRIIL